jgi:flagellin-specific chaperone FliS
VDIRNLKKLYTEMINNISNMSIENIMVIINTYNEVTDAFSKFIENFK